MRDGMEGKDREEFLTCVLLLLSFDCLRNGLGQFLVRCSRPHDVSQRNFGIAMKTHLKEQSECLSFRLSNRFLSILRIWHWEWRKGDSERRLSAYTENPFAFLLYNKSLPSHFFHSLSFYLISGRIHHGCNMSPLSTIFTIDRGNPPWLLSLSLCVFLARCLENIGKHLDHESILVDYGKRSEITNQCNHTLRFPSAVTRTRLQVEQKCSVIEVMNPNSPLYPRIRNACNSASYSSFYSYQYQTSALLRNTPPFLWPI